MCLSRFIFNLYGVIRWKTKVPIVIISKEEEVYPSVMKAWELVGTQEEDGVFILRDMNYLEIIDSLQFIQYNTPTRTYLISKNLIFF